MIVELEERDEYADQCAQDYQDYLDDIEMRAREETFRGEGLLLACVLGSIAWAILLGGTWLLFK